MHSPFPLTHDIVLIGGGHSHALVLQIWAMDPLPGARLTVINPGPTAAYSGMLPGFVAGHYMRDDLDIDLVRLAQAAGAQLIIGRATGIDRAAQTIQIEGRPDIAYDIASIDIGITTEMPDMPGFADHAIPAKPLDTFAHRWDAYRAAPTGDIAIIGGGVAGAELAMAMAHGAPGRDVHLIDRGTPISELSPRARSQMITALNELGVSIHSDRAVTAVTGTGVTLADGSEIPAQFVTGVAAPRAQSWPTRAGLECHNGFITIAPDLRSSDPAIFATGDCAHMAFAPRPKAGVFAVRQAPVLFHNLRAAALGRRLRSYRPQRGYLKLISLGGRKALAEKGGMVLSGRAMWRWKDRIDRKFMTRLNDLRPMTPAKPLGTADAPMMCAGCGSKVGRGPLRAALAKTPALQRDDIQPLPGDDAALLRMGDIRQVLTTDHLRALTPDPYVMTQIAAQHALGDLWAMGAQPQSAMLSVTLPRQSAELQTRSMAQIMAAADQVLTPAGAAIIGGHSSMGAELIIGFSLTGLLDRDPITLAGARAGDALILTKPIGSGAIMAGHMRLQAPGDTVAQTLHLMCQSQGSAARILHDARAMTDVTGFGLAGHLAGMCEASGVGAQVNVADVPILPGARAVAEAGIRSSLWEDNVAGAAVSCPTGGANDLMFDPQTSGGLLAAVPVDRSAQILEQLANAGYSAAQIGEITPTPDVIFR